MINMNSSTYRAYIDINLNNLKYNLKQIQQVSKSKNICAVVKANAYGHGSVDIATYLEKEKLVSAFAVADLDEAICLRECGISSDILIFGQTNILRLDSVAKHNLIQTIDSLDYAKLINNNGIKIRTHLAIDTGMTRIGINGYTLSSFISEFSILQTFSNIILEGVFTHLSVADSTDIPDIEYTKNQIKRITEIGTYLKRNISPGIIVHYLNSAGAIYYSSEESDWIRIGILMYGLYPNPKNRLPFIPKPVLSVHSTISLVRAIPTGTSIGYGRTFVSPKPMRIGIVPFGYADGYPRALSNNYFVLINEKKIPIVGRICMDQFMVDLTDTDISVGDQVTIIGSQGNLNITLDDIAAQSNTISYELACNISRRVHRNIHETF